MRIFLVAVCGTLFISRGISAELNWSPDELDYKIAAVNGRSLSAHSREEKEKQVLELLQEYKTPQQEGRIYTAIAMEYQNDPKKYFAKVIKFSRLALTKSLSVEDEVRMNMALAAALTHKYDLNGNAPNYPDARRAIARPVLNGLKVVLDNLTVNSRAKEPEPRVYHVRTLSEKTEQVYAEKRKKQMAQLAEARRQNDFLEKREQFFNDLVSLYMKGSYDKKDLRVLGNEILTKKHESVVDELVSAVSERRKERDKKRADQAARPFDPNKKREVKGTSPSIQVSPRPKKKK